MSIKISKRASKIILGALVCAAFVIGGYYVYEHRPVEQREIDADVVAIKIVPTETKYSFFTQDQKEIQKIYSVLSSEYNNDHARDYDWSITFYKDGKAVDKFLINERESEYHLKLKPYLLRARESKQKTSELKVLLNEMLPHKLVYSKNGFEVRETQILDDAGHEAEDYFSLENVERIENTEKNYVPDIGCCSDDFSGQKCQASFVITDYSGGKHEFNFEEIARSGLYNIFVFKKDGNKMWEGSIVGIACLPFHSIVQIDDKIAVDYHNIIGVMDADANSMRDSIFLMGDNNLRDLSKEEKYDQAFSPHSIRGELAYFGRQGDQVWLNYDDEKVTYYEEILTDHDGDECYPSVFSDGNIIDFFARKNGKVFHVQAGYFDEEIRE